MPDLKPPAEQKHTDRERARQAAALKAIIAFLLVAAVIVAGFVKIIPLPLRLLVAATDIIGAAVLWLVLRQKFSTK